MSNDQGGASGVIEWELRGPDGEVKTSGRAYNKITETGDQRYAMAGAGIATGQPAVPTGMKLGTGGSATAASKNGAGAETAGTYVTGSNKLFDTTPTHALVGGLREITYVCTYAAGVATATDIDECVIVNDAATNADSTGANTYARVVLSPEVNKGASDTLTITWKHTIGSL